MRIGVYGLGRFGRLWAGMLAEKHELLGFNRSPLQEPLPGVRIVGEEELFECEAVFFCVAISSLKEVLERTARWVSPGTLIADTCSVKLFPGRWMESTMPPGVSLLGTHPMFGPDSVTNGPAGLPLVLCPVQIGDEELRRWTGIFNDFGFSTIMMSADDHDHKAAYSQGITHFVGRVLDDLGITSQPLATLGYKKILEVKEQTCNDPWRLFLDLQRYNPYTGEMRRQLTRSLNRVLESIQPESTQTLDTPKNGK